MTNEEIRNGIAKNHGNQVCDCEGCQIFNEETQEATRKDERAKVIEKLEKYLKAKNYPNQIVNAMIHHLTEAK